MYVTQCGKASAIVHLRTTGYRSIDFRGRVGSSFRQSMITGRDRDLLLVNAAKLAKDHGWHGT